MRVKDILRKLERILDLDGVVTGLDETASMFAGRVKHLAARVGEVSEAISARQYGDAIQKLSEEPGALDDLETLRFGRIDAWIAFCESRKLARPEFPPKEETDKINSFLRSPYVADPAQKLYRKAIRTRDAALSVFSLRLLVATDKSRDWRGDLSQAEDARKRELSALVAEAEGRGEREKACELAERLLDSGWLEPPPAEITTRAKDVIASFEADDIAREQDEALDLLRLCGDNWDAVRAGSLIAYLDKLAASGTTVPGDDAGMVAAARARCEADAKAAAFDAAWRAASERLFIAVGHESPDEIRAAISAVEFQDRPPDEEVYRKARLVILHDEAKKRQRMRIVATLVLISVGSLVAVSAAWLRNRNFNRQCAEEAGNLELLAQRGEINALEEVLGKIRAAAPNVWDDPRVQKYEHRLAELRTEQSGVLEGAEKAVLELETLQDAGWGKTEDAVLEKKVAATADLLGKVVYKGIDDRRSPVASRFAEVKASYDEYAAERLAERVAEAEKAFPPLLAEMREIAGKLETQFLSGSFATATTNCEEKAKGWLSRYSDCSPDLAAQIEAADFTLARKKSADGAALMAKLLGAANCDAAIKARRDLMEFYGGFDDVKAMSELGYGEAEAEALLADGPANISVLGDYIASFSGKPDETMLERVRETMGKADELLGEAHGIRLSDDSRYLRFAVGQYRYSKTQTGYDVRGDLLWLENGRVANGGNVKSSPNSPIQVDTLPSTEDIRELRSAASDVAATPDKLGSLLRGKIAAICANAAKPSFLEAQKVVAIKPDERQTGARKPDPHRMELRSFVWEKDGGDSAYRMTQMLNVYLNWLSKLEMLPESDEMEKLRGECRELALPVTVKTSEGEDLGKEYEKYTWLFAGDRLVDKRNAECSRFLKRVAGSGFAERLKAYSAIAPGLGYALTWRVAFAGTLGMEPAVDGKVVTPPCGEGAVTLYALRPKGERRVLIPVLVPNNGAYAKTRYAADIGLSQGEPLFRFMAEDGAIDAELQLGRTLKAAPPDIRDDIIRVFHCE